MPGAARAPRTAAATKTAANGTDRLRAEVKPGDRIGLLDGHELVVKPVKKWKSSATHAMRIGDWQEWARTSLAGDGYSTWLEVDPDGEQVDAFLDSWREATGEDLGESQAS